MAFWRLFYPALTSGADWRVDVRLAEALRLAPGSMVTFVGAGGKTSSLRRLVEERESQELLLVTCTTRLAYSERDMAAHHLEVGEAADLRVLPELLRRHGSLLITGSSELEEGKLEGLPPEWVERARDRVRSVGAVVAVEGDGARGRWLKGPANHEPLVPTGTDVFVPCMNLNALDQRLDEEVAHRPERVAELVGTRMGDRITAEHAVRLLTHLDGGMKGRPQGAEVRVQLTGATGEEARRKVIAGLLKSDSVRGVIHVPQPSPASDVICHGRIGAVVLAAGESTRMDSLKQVMPWRGKPMIQHSVDAARDGELAPIVVVTGAQAERIRKVVEGESVRFEHNPAWQQGQSTSLKVGLKAVQDQVEAVVFLLADMPLVSSILIEELVAEHRRTLAPIIAPRAGGRFGNPVLFDRATFTDLGTISGDRGGRALYDRYDVTAVPAGEGALIDLDSPDDFKRLEDAAGEESLR